ncbi:MAG: kelch repeat-containing protein [Terracidiphilus sp.]
MPGTWKTFNAPNTSTGEFNADLMILLTDGSVLMHNGYVTALNNAHQWLRLTPDKFGKYEGGTWSGELDMKNARQWFASGVLKDGRVFAIGGEYSSDPMNPTDSPLGEIFDPQTNTWTALNKPAAFDFVRGDCNGAVLKDGRVLLGGPATAGAPPTWPKLTAIWDPATNNWVEAGTKFGTVANTKEDPFEEETFSLLRSGDVLVPAVRDTPKAQCYDPERDEWVKCGPSPVKLAIDTLLGVEVFETGPTIVLPDGKAFCIGGTGKTAIYTPGPHPTSHGTWTKGPDFPNDTSGSPNWPLLTPLDAPACLLPNGKVVLMAGTTSPDSGDYFSLNPVLLEYDHAHPVSPIPQLDVQPPAFPTSNFTWQSCFLLLPTGQMLCSAQSNTLYLYTPDPAAGSPHHSWRPAHIEVPEVMHPGHSYTLSGLEINGLSQAVCYGDDAGMATNYPIVRIHHRHTNEVTYLRSYDFSTMGIATGREHHDRKHCTIDIPSSLVHGHYELVVIANGISSEPVGIEIGWMHHHGFEGRIESLVYDSAGEFDAFTVEDEVGAVRRYESREPHVADLTRRAWQERTRVRVVTEDHHSHHAVSIALLV